MKLVLLQAPVQDFYDTEVRLQPLGLCYLKASVLQHLPGTQVIVKDFHQGWGRRTVALPAELSDLRGYYPYPDRSPFCTFHGYYHFGAPFETVAEEVLRERPDLVGISSPFSPYYREVLRCAEEIKKRTDVPVVAGGAHASAAPLSLLEHPAVDFVVRGEGERPLVELVRALSAGDGLERVPNLGFKRGGRIHWNPPEENYPWEHLPAPDFSDLGIERYRLGKRPLASLVASRGCPRRCSFCSIHQVFERYRARPVEDVVEEIRLRHAQGYRALDFEDDNLTPSADGMRKLCLRLIQSFPEGSLALHAMNGVSYLDLNPDLLRLMRRAGFAHLNLSLVSMDEGVCRRAHRSNSPGHFEQTALEAARLGFRLVSYLILGLPGDTLGSMVETTAFLSRLPALLGASPFYLCPGSPLAQARPELSEAEMVRSRLTVLGVPTDRFSRDDIYTLFVTARIVNFLKGLEPGAGSCSLGEALAAARILGRRQALGADLLERLLAEGRLWAATPQGLRPLPRFKATLFRAAWNRIGFITTQGGRRIDL
jgi:radical SAM superfamily enzyme YgiQ (UPF0313 family)